jgi:hypothetical protein
MIRFRTYCLCDLYTPSKFESRCGDLDDIESICDIPLCFVASLLNLVGGGKFWQLGAGLQGVLETGCIESPERFSIPMQSTLSK